MKKNDNSVAPQQINSSNTQTIRQSAPFYLDLSMLPTLFQPNGMQLMMKNTEYNPNGLGPNIQLTVRIIVIVMIVKALLFSVLPLIMGVVYQSQCQIQEMIPRFLMILGIKGIAENLFFCVLVIILMFIMRKRSELDRRKKLDYCIAIWLTICVISNIGWIITGSVWTFGVKNRVQFDDTEKANYCHSTLYWYAFVWCILWNIYIFMEIIFGIPCGYKLQKKLIKMDKEFNPAQHTIPFS